MSSFSSHAKASSSHSIASQNQRRIQRLREATAITQQAPRLLSLVLKAQSAPPEPSSSPLQPSRQQASWDDQEAMRSFLLG